MKKLNLNLNHSDSSARVETNGDVPFLDGQYLEVPLQAEGTNQVEPLPTTRRLPMPELTKNSFSDAIGSQTSSPKKGRKSPKSKKAKKARLRAERCAVALKMIAAGELRSTEEAAEITEDSPESIFRLQRALAYGDLELAGAILQGDRTIGNVDTWLRHPDRKDTVESILNTRKQNVVIPPDVASLQAEARRLEAEAARLEQVVGGTSISGGLRVPSINTEAMQLKQQASNLREEFHRRSSPLLLLAMETLAALSHLLPPDTDSGQTVPQEER